MLVTVESYIKISQVDTVYFLHLVELMEMILTQTCTHGDYLP